MLRHICIHTSYTYTHAHACISIYTHVFRHGGAAAAESGGWLHAGIIPRRMIQFSLDSLSELTRRVRKIESVVEG